MFEGSDAGAAGQKVSLSWSNSHLTPSTVSNTADVNYVGSQGRGRVSVFAEMHVCPLLDLSVDVLEVAAREIAIRQGADLDSADGATHWRLRLVAGCKLVLDCDFGSGSMFAALSTPEGSRHILQSTRVIPEDENRARRG